MLRETVDRAAAVGLAADRRLPERGGPRADRARRGLASVDVADPAGRSGTIRQEDHGEHVPALAAAALERRGRYRPVARDAGVRGRVRADRRQAGADRGAGPAAAQAAGRGRAPLFRRSDRSADRDRDGLFGRRGEGARVEGAGPAARHARASRAHDRRCDLVNTEERQLAEMLHRVTPEPPRRVTVEDVAFRMASEPGRGSRSGRGFSLSKVFGGGRGWTPVLAALSVFAIAGASAGIATVATSHHSRTGAPSDGTPPATASVSGSPSPTSQTQTPAGQPLRVAGGMWGAELINRQSFNQGSLASSGDALFAVGDGSLARI